MTTFEACRPKMPMWEWANRLCTKSEAPSSPWSWSHVDSANAFYKLTANDRNHINDIRNLRNSFKIMEFKGRLEENGRRDDIISTTSKAASSFRVSGRGLRRERLLRVLNARSEVFLPFLPKQKMARRRRKAATRKEGAVSPLKLKRIACVFLG